MSSLALILCLLLLLNAVYSGYADQCMHCIAQGEERTCDDGAEFLECTEELAEKYLSLFMRVNEDLDVKKADKTRFKCFKFMVLGEELFHLKGCTYEDLPICDNLHDNMHCESCKGKDCNSLFVTSYDDEDDRAGTHVSSIGLMATCVLIIGLFRFTLAR